MNADRRSRFFHTTVPVADCASSWKTLFARSMPITVIFSMDLSPFRTMRRA
jgi:hypothetical protein